MNDTIKKIQIQQEELQKYLPIPPETLKLIDGFIQTEITLEALTFSQENSFSRSEIALILEKGITVPGKSLTDHLEAINHAKSFEFVKTLTSTYREDLTEENILQIHYILTNSTNPQTAGTYRTTATKIPNAPLSLPPAAKVPLLMANLIDQIRKRPTTHPIQNAAEIARQFMDILPFATHNASVARLLLNLLLMQEGYPPAILKNDPFKTTKDNYYHTIQKGVENTLNMYLEAAQHKEVFLQKRVHRPLKTSTGTSVNLLTIGALAKAAGEKVPTIRYWTHQGLLTPSSRSQGGYHLYDPAMIDQAKKVRKLQKQKRLTIRELQKKFSAESQPGFTEEKKENLV